MRVALTFDAEHPDRPNHGAGTPAVLDALERLGLRTAFFLQGRWVEAFPELARRVADEGHLVGHHSFYHARMPLLSDDGFAEDVREAERAIIETTGTDPRPWARFPFGAGADRADLVERLAQLGYRHVGWDVECYEWDTGRSADEIAAAAIEGVLRQGDGTIVLLHTWPDPVAPALARIVERLRAEDARFVGIDELELPDGLTPIGEPRPPVAAPMG